MKYFFNPSARAELLEQVAFYESRTRKLGARFLVAFETAMARVCEAPHRPRVEFPPNIRLYRVRGFPYSVLYREAGSEVEVLAVAAHRRQPGYWIGRLQQ